MKSWGRTALAFLPNSLREFSERALFFPPLVKGGKGGMGRATVECTTGHKLGAIDEIDCACGGLASVARGSLHVMGVLLLLSALAIVIDPVRARRFCYWSSLASAALPWRAAWRGASGTALAPCFDLGGAALWRCRSVPSLSPSPSRSRAVGPWRGG